MAGGSRDDDRGKKGKEGVKEWQEGEREMIGKEKEREGERGQPLPGLRSSTLAFLVYGATTEYSLRIHTTL